MMQRVFCMSLLVLMWAPTMSAATQIQDTIYTGFPPQVFEGRVTISGPAMTTIDGRMISRWSRDYQISDGQINVEVEPNDTATPSGTSYYVVYRPKSGLAWSEYWVVPTSETPLRIADVRVPHPPAPQMIIAPAMISRAGASSGQCLAWIDGSWRPADCGATGAVVSVFGRTGAITAQAGDYSFSQISGTVSTSQLPSGIDASLVGAGMVSNEEFGYLDGVTGSLQTQIDGKAPLSHTHSGSDITSGTVAEGLIDSAITRDSELAAGLAGKADTAHTHSLTDLQGVSGKQGTGSILQAFGGGTVNANDCAKFDANGNLVSAGAACNATAGLADPGSNGMVARTAENVTVARTIQGTANQITVMNGDGSSGNPTIAFSSTPDWSGLTSTKPIKTGTSLPATCSVGEAYFKTDATASKNLFLCTATNTWTQQGGMGEPASNGLVAKTGSGTSAARTIQGTANEIVVTNGDGVSGNPVIAFSNTPDWSGKTSTKPVKVGTSLPGSCSVGELFYHSTATAGQNLYGCTSTNTWSLLGDGTGTSLPSQTGNANRFLSTNGSVAEWRSFGVGLVSDASGAAIDTAVVATKQDDNTFTGENVFQDGVMVAGASAVFDATDAAKTLPFKSGTAAAAPTTCIPNEEYYNETDGTLKRCNATGNGWVNHTHSGSDITSGTVAEGLIDSAITRDSELAAGLAGKADTAHTHSLTDLQGVSGKQGTGSILQAFGGGTVNANDCAKFDANGNLVSAGAACNATAGLADPGSNGIVVRTANGVTTARSIAGTSGQINVTNGDGVSGNPTLALDDRHRTRQFTFLLGAENGSALADTDDQPSIWSNQLGYSVQITKVWCETDGGTSTIQLQRDDGSPANMLSSNLSCTSSGASTTSFVSGENNISDGNRVDFVMVSAGGTAKRLTLVVRYVVQ